MYPAGHCRFIQEHGAINSIYPETDIQSFIVHQIRNYMKYVASKDQKAFMKDLKPVYKADTKQEAEIDIEALLEKWERKYPVVIKSSDKQILLSR